jgi:hypothetical protein
VKPPAAAAAMHVAAMEERRTDEMDGSDAPK